MSIPFRKGNDKKISLYTKKYIKYKYCDLIHKKKIVLFSIRVFQLLTTPCRFCLILRGTGNASSSTRGVARAFLALELTFQHELS